MYYVCWFCKVNSMLVHCNVLSSAAKESTHDSPILFAMKIVLNGSRVAWMHWFALLCAGVCCVVACVCLWYGETYVEISSCSGVSSRCSNPKKRCRFILKCTKLRLEVCSQKFSSSFLMCQSMVVNWFGLASMLSGWGPFATTLLERGLLFLFFVWTMDSPAFVSEPWMPLINF